MLFVAGLRGDVGAHVIDQFARRHGAVFVLVRAAFQGFYYRICERPVAAAELRPFESRLLRPRRHQPEHFARRLAQFLHGGAD